MDKKVKLTVAFEAVDEDALQEAIRTFAEESQDNLPGQESSLSTAGWRYTSRLARLPDEPPAGHPGNA